MYVEFTHINNKAIIKRDDSNTTEIVPYYDNLKKVLIQENVIELMEEEKKKLLKDYDYYKDKKINYIPLATLFVEVFGYFGMPFIFKAAGAPEEWLNEITNSGLTNKEIIRYISIMLGFAAGIFMDCNLYVSCSVNKKRKNGTIVEKELLEKQINFEKSLLEELQNDKTNTNIQGENDYEIIDIDTKLISNKVNYLINLFYNLGYDEKKLYKCFIKDKLEKYYSGGLLEQAIKYFEEKGPVLAKKYNTDKSSM